MSSSFTQKILTVYFNMMKDRRKGSFRAFCILLKSIKFVPNDEFIDRILSIITNDREKKICHRLIEGSPLRECLMDDFRLSYQDIGSIFEALLFLKTRISSSIMYSLCKEIRSKDLKEYLKGLFYAYFDLIKKEDLWKFNLMDSKDQLKFLIKNIPTSVDRNIYNYGPRRTTNNGVWGSLLPLYIKSIPMGGINKKY